MRRAYHVNNQEMFEIPLQLSMQEIQNLKRLATKGTFECPYCNAKLRVDSGDIRGTYFSHHKSESCIESELAEQTYYTYKEQIKREDVRQQIVVALLLNELKGLAKLHHNLKVEAGSEVSVFQKYVPDIVVELGNRKYAMNVVTNINGETDFELSKNLVKRQNYFREVGYESIWFVERKHVAIEITSQEIVFWDSEKVSLQMTEEDYKWTNFLQSFTDTNLLSEVLGLKKKLDTLIVKNIIYLSPKNNGKFLLYRFIEEIETKPFRAYFLNDPYEMTMAEALQIRDNQFCLGIAEKDENNRKLFKTHYDELLQQYTFAKEKEKEKQEEVRQREKLSQINNYANNYSGDFKTYTNQTVVQPNAEKYKKYLNSFSFENELSIMNGVEQRIFNTLIEKYQLSRGNYPGICKIEITPGNKILTPFSVWQLWIIDQILTTFQTKPLTVYELLRRFRPIFRIDRNAGNDIRDVLYGYLEILEYVGFLKHRTRDAVSEPFPVLLKTLPLLDDFKMNSYVAFRHSRYYMVNDRHVSDSNKANDEYKMFVKKVISSTYF